MNKVTAKDVKNFRAQTGAGMMEAKSALEESGGDMKLAEQILRKRGALKAGKKADRVTKAGLIESYIHGEGRIGVLLEVGCETDFVARNEEFKGLAHALALQIAASAPLFVSREDVPADIVEKEKSIYAEQATAEGKGPEIAGKIVAGKLEKFYQEACLLEQPFIRDDSMTVQELINQKIAKIGENIQVRRFVRYVLGN